MHAERKALAPGHARAAASTLSAESAIRIKPTDRRKTLGIYYTPKDLVHSLTDWAIVGPADTVLEPSFGGCGFLDESAKLLAQRGAVNPWGQLCGCDKDSKAFGYLPPIYRQRKRNRRFVHNNYLATKPVDYATPGKPVPNEAHPLFHLHHGGKAMKARREADGNCWGHCLELSGPRVVHPPMDLILAFDFILSNATGPQWRKQFSKDKDYTAAVRNSQRRFWRPHQVTLSDYYGCGHLKQTAHPARLLVPTLLVDAV